MILLVHAGHRDASMWDGFDLPGAERHELRGFGDTPMPPEGEFSHADDLEARIGDGPASLVGRLLRRRGLPRARGAAARARERAGRARCARAGPRLVRADVTAFYQEEDRLLEEGDLDSAADLNARFWAPSVADRVRPMQRRSFELQLASAAEETYAERIELGAIRARTLVVVGEEDKADFRAIAARLADEIPDARLVTMPGVTHLPSLERPDETAALVREFLGR